MDTDPLPFTLDWLAEAANRQAQLSSCTAGHLVVRNNTCWRPLHFSPDLRSLYCEPVDHPDKATSGE